MCSKRSVSGCSDHAHLSRFRRDNYIPQSEVRNQAAGTGSAVTDLIFSMAKREVTFFSGTVAISFL